jgi:hypothetical protein
MKQLILLFLLIFGTQFSKAQDEILLNFPKEVHAGNEFLLVVNIPKNFMSGAARFQLVFPNGFTATSRKTENADFKFETNKATFFWLNFPQNQEVEISVNLTPAVGMEGYFVIKGESNWLKEGHAYRTELYPQVLTVKPGSLTEESIQQNLEKTRFKYEELETQGVSCLRQVPYEEQGEIYVNLLINKGDLNMYGKIQENIPPGYEAVNLKSQNAIFVYNKRQNIVKYLWMNMPEKSQYIVSYKLVPTAKVDESNPFLIFGTFSYALNNQTLTIDIQERGIDLSTAP